MRRVLDVVVDIALVSALLLVLVALWGFRSSTTDVDIPATVRMDHGVATAVHAGSHHQQPLSNPGSLSTGDTLQMPATSSGFVLFADGSISRVTGPAVLTLQESHQTAHTPSFMSGVTARLRGAQPPAGSTTLTVQAMVQEGEVTTKVAAPPSPTSQFILRGPNAVILASSASFIFTVPQNGDPSIEVGQGPISVAMVSTQDGAPVPVVIPALVSSKGIIIPSLPPDQMGSAEVSTLIVEAQAAIPPLREASGPVTVDGIAYQPVSADIPYFAGPPINSVAAVSAGSPGSALSPTQVFTPTTTIPTATPPPTTTPTVAPTTTAVPTATATHAAVARATVIVGASTGVMTVYGTAQLDGSPAPSGTAIEVTKEDGAVVGTGTTGGDGQAASAYRIDFQVDSSWGGQTGKVSVAGDQWNTQSTPVVLSDTAVQVNLVATTIPPVTAQATPAPPTPTPLPSYFTTVAAPKLVTTDSTAADAIPLSLPHTVAYFKSIPTPREVSTDWKIVGTNALLALVITFLVGSLAGVASNLVQSSEDGMLSGMKRLADKAKKITGWRGFRGRVGSWWRTARLTRAVLILLIFGALYTFLNSGAGLFGPGGFVLLITLALTAGFFSLYEPWVRTYLAKKLRVTARVALYPGQLLVGLISVAASRLFAFTPGLMLGQPGGLQIEDEIPENKKLWFDAWSLTAVGALGMAAWGVTFMLPLITGSNGGGFASSVQDWCLAAFAMASQRVFFGLAPFQKGTGREFMKKNVFLWAIPFGIAAFIFLHTEFNTNGSIVDLTPRLIFTFIVTLVLAVAAQTYMFLHKRKRVSVTKVPGNLV